MLPDSFREFFVAIVGADGALIGLLFVAVSLAPRRLRDPKTSSVAQAQASAALLIFSNVLVLGLVSLIPAQDIGWATIALAILGVAYALANGRVALARWRIDRRTSRSLARIAFGALVLSGFEIWAGIEIVSAPLSDNGFHTLAWTSAIGLVFGISRAWELIGLPGNSLLRTVAVLRDPTVAENVLGPEEPPAAG